MTHMPNITPAGASPAGPEDVRAKLAFLHSSIAASTNRSGGHEAGTQMRQLANWTPPLRSVDSDTLPDIDNSKARARDLARNNDPFAANAARIDRDSVVGPGLRLSLKPDHVLLGIDAAKAREWARMVERRWDAYANSTGHLFPACLHRPPLEPVLAVRQSKTAQRYRAQSLGRAGGLFYPRGAPVRW